MHPIHRPYQLEAQSAIKAAWARGKSAVLCLPTGTGKTITALGAVSGMRFLFVVHRDYLLHQTAKQSSQPLALLSGKRKEKNLHARSICATQQWLSRPKNLARVLESGAFDALVVDEAHHAVANSWKAIIAQFKHENPAANVLGMTATLQRADGIPLCEVFDELAYYKPIKWFCDNDYLAPVRSFTFDCDIDVSKVRTSRNGEDFVLGDDLVAAVNTSNWLQVTVDAWKEHAAGLKTLAFSLTLENSKQLCAAFIAQGIPAAHVDADTPQETRAQIDADFRAGKLLVLCNVGIYTEGYDVPDAECAIMARPTKSQLYYMQCVGRVLRPMPGKTAVVLDMADTRHTLAQFGDIEPAYRAQSERDLIAIKGFGGQFFDALLLGLHQRRGLVQFGHARDAYARIINLLRNGKLAWGVFGGRALLTSGKGDLFVASPGEAADFGVEHGKYALFLISNQQARLIASADPFEVLEKAADFAEQYATILSDATAQWRALPPTQAQMQMLIEHMHLSAQALVGVGRGEASLLISYIKACDALDLPVGSDWDAARDQAKAAWLAQRQLERDARNAQYQAQREQERLVREQARLQAQAQHIEQVREAMAEIITDRAQWADETQRKVFAWYREILTTQHSFNAWEQDFIKSVVSKCAEKRGYMRFSSRQMEVIEKTSKRLRIHALEREIEGG